MKDFSRLEPIDYLRIPWKRRWYFLSSMGIVLIGVSIFAWFRPNIYRSETRIVVDSATLLDDPLSPTAARDRTEDRVNSIRQLLESRKILGRIIEEFRARAVNTSLPLEEALKNIRRRLEVSKAVGGTFTMAYSDSDPLVARDITARLADLFIQENQLSQRNKALDKDQFMEQELRQAEMELTAIDDRIKQFKASHLGELPEQSTANMNALSSLHNQLIAIDNTLDRARDQQKTIEFRIQEQRRTIALAKSIMPKEKPVPVETQSQRPPLPLESLLATKRAQLAEATARFTAKHPDVIRLASEVKDIEQQIAKIHSTVAEEGVSQENAQRTASSGRSEMETSGEPQLSQMEISAEAEIAQAKYELDMLSKTISRREKEREDILKSINLYQNRLNLAPALEQELLALTREHETKKQQVASLGTRKFNAQMAANAVADKKNDIYRILDEASLPEKPLFPTKVHILWIGIGASLLVGFAAAFGREYFESSLANEEEAAAVLNLPVLASIPEI
jgi:polysaccharide biosynthesis transport protein